MLRIIWKAERLETCMFGLGLGSGCNSPVYTTFGCANGASGLWSACRARGRFPYTHWTPEPCLQKSVATRRVQCLRYIVGIPSLPRRRS